MFAALANAVVLFLMSFYILYEAYSRFREPPEGNNVIDADGGQRGTRWKPKRRLPVQHRHSTIQVEHVTRRHSELNL